MSAFASVSSGTNATLLQQLRQDNAPGSFNRAAFDAQRKAEFGQALLSSGVDPAKVGDIQSQIDAAVQSARQSGSNSRSSIKDAVASVLKSNGVDPAKFDQALKSAHSARRGGKTRGNDHDADDGGTNVGSVGAIGTPAASASPVSSLLSALSTGTAPSSQLYGDVTGSLLDIAA